MAGPRSAFENPDRMNYNNEPLFAPGEKGFPNEKVDSEVLLKDPCHYWLCHEQKLWGIVVFCAMFFIAILL